MAGHWLAAEQQSPPTQQRPFWQWLATQSESSSHTLLSARSGTHTLASQCALLSQSPSAAQVAPQMGVVWSAAPLHDTLGYDPQMLATVEALQAVSSGTFA